MSASRNADVSLRDIYRLFFRHKRKMAAFFTAVMLLAVAATLWSPKIYRSEGAVFVRLGRENATLDATTTLNEQPVVTIPASRKEEMNTAVQILRSPALAEQVIDRLGPAKILSTTAPTTAVAATPAKGAVPAEVATPAPENPVAKSAENPAKSDDEPGALKAWLYEIGLLTPLTQRERALAAFSENLEVESVKDSNIIRVRYESRSPELSQLVVDALMSEFLERHIELNRAPGAHDFLEKQAEQLRAELAKAEATLRDLKTSTGLTDPAGQRQILVERIGRMEDELLRTRAELVSAESELAVLAEKLKTLPAEQVTAETAGVGNEGTDGMRQQLYTLQLQEKELSAAYTDQHPKLRAVRQQLAAAREALKSEDETRTHVTRGPNRSYEEAQLAQLRQQPVHAALAARSEKLETQLESVRGELAALNENEMQLAQLNREVLLHEANYRRYAGTLEQTRIDGALGTEKISNIAVSQPATFVAKPVRPQKLLNFALGLAIATIGSICLAVVAEFLDHSFRTPEDIERQLNMPALGAIPAVGRRRLEMFTKS